MKTPIIVITGYLGAGKTTLLKRILSETDQKIAIVMNEFGEINIDAKIIKQKNFDMVELQGGCVCCSLTGEFEFAIEEILNKIKPEYIIVETTGVAEPDSLIFDIQDNIPKVRLDAVITIVDADSMIRFPSIGNTARAQIENADIVLINKVDLINKNQINEVKEKIKELNNKAALIETIKCNILSEIIFVIKADKKEIKLKEHEHIDIESFIFKTNKKLNKERFIEFIKNMPENFYRIKGFINFGDCTYLFNFVAGRYELEKNENQNTELVFIGKDINKEKEGILKELKSLEN